MEQALEQILEIRSEMDQMQARDHHELAKCIDAESMVLCAELFYRASLTRTESRGFHCREDYPEMDNDIWLKWVIVKDVNGEMTVSTEDIPINRYPYKPVNQNGQ
jgi:succinate dehydrogenase/fumarate reductase flavoprotein subunit